MKNFTIAFIALFVVSCNSSSEKSLQEENLIEKTEEVVVDIHTSENALDWAGVYVDTMPCADCSGILTSLTLANDGTYSLAQIYLDESEEPVVSQGTLSWDDNGRVISLSDNDKMNFFVGENILFFLDENMEKITGDLADFYSLEKVIN